MQSVSPVFTEAEVDLERVIALDQPEYQPILIMPISLDVVNSGDNPITMKDGSVCESGAHYLVQNWGAAVRFRFSDEERAMIAAGADLVITEMVFGAPFTPINLQFCQPNERPEF